MTVFEIFSKRSKKTPDIFIYDELPIEFRTQVVHILNDVIGGYFYNPNSYDQWEKAVKAFWDFVFQVLIKEYGVFKLVEDAEYDDNSYEQCISFLLTTDNIERALDVIEIAFKLLDRGYRNYFDSSHSESLMNNKIDDAIEELNSRFLEHGIGYSYENGIIIKKDSQFIHEQITRNALFLLNYKEFDGAQEEFLNSHKFFRTGEKEQALAEALKSFESTMKIICDLQSWKYPENATAIPLLNILIDNELIPKSLTSHFSGLRSTLESGLPTIANKQARHGQGKQKRDIDNEIVEYALNLCATNIVLLI